MEDHIAQGAQNHVEMGIMPLDVAIYAQSSEMNADMDSLLAVSMYIYLKENRERNMAFTAATMQQR